VDIPPAEIGSSHASAEVDRVVAADAMREFKFTARLDAGETTINFNDLPEDEEAAIEYLRDQHA
jgi:hypothetical protein